MNNNQRNEHKILKLKLTKLNFEKYFPYAIIRRCCIWCGAGAIVLGLTMGLLDWYGCPMHYTKFIGEFLSYLSFFAALAICVSQRSPVRSAALFLLPIVLCGFVGFISALLGTEGILGGILFFRWIISFSLLGAAFLIISPTEKELRYIRIVVVGLVLLQPVVAIIKGATIGIVEKYWIGTLSQNAGQFGLLLPLLAISFLLPRFLFNMKLNSPLLILAFILFAIVNEKRGAVFMLPAWIAMIFLTYNFFWMMRKKTYGIIIKRKRYVEFLKGAVCAVLIVVTFVSMTSLSPSLNSQEKIGGDISIGFVFKYSLEYLNRDYDHFLNNPVENIEEDVDIQLGRFRAILKIWEFMASQPAGRFLFGFGGGFVNNSHILGEDRSDILFARTGIRSSIPAASRLLIEAGLVGFILLVVWFAVVTSELIRIFFSSVSPYAAAFSLGVLGTFGMVAFDFFVYSSTVWTADVLSPLIFALVGVELGRQSSMVRNNIVSHKDPEI